MPVHYVQIYLLKDVRNLDFHCIYKSTIEFSEILQTANWP